jgi:UDP-N-acetylglucosamine 2-epimerase (non-hydrolysing)
MEEMGVVMTGLNPERILQAIELVAEQQELTRAFRLVSDYAMPNVSLKVERIILSYTDYIRRKVWHK